MPSKSSRPTSPAHAADDDAKADADLARAFRELAKGERTASAMETRLTGLERKIDALLATATNAHEPGNAAGKSEKQSDKK